MLFESDISPDVFLLLDDLQDAQRLSFTFRKMGVVPHLYDSLEKFGKAVLKHKPDLAIVDLLKMREDNYVLKNHPFVRDESLPLVFFSDRETQHLLASSHGLFHFGVIQKAASYESQLRPLLKRVNKYLFMKYSNSEYKKQVEQKQKRVGELLKNLQSYQEQESLKTIELRLLNQIEERLKRGSFMEACLQVLGQWDVVEQFSSFEMSSNGQRLFSQNKDVNLPQNYQPLPALWLGEANDHGIDSIVQTMALNQAKDFLGERLMALRVWGAAKNPDHLFLLRMDSEFSLEFNWSSFEKNLSRLYCRTLLEQKHFTEVDLKQTSQVLNGWEMLSFLDQQENQWRTRNSSLVELRFEKLMSVIKENSELKFYWQTFLADFLGGLRKKIFRHYVTAAFGLERLCFLVRKQDLVPLREEMSSYAESFPYWRYFEDPTLMLATALNPSLETLPAQSRDYFESLVRRPQQIPVAKRSPKVYVQREAPRLEI